MAWTERYVTHDAAGGGDGSSGTPWTLAEAIAAVAAGDRVNIKAGTYANTTTTRTFATAGSATAPIWWRGYNTSIGDIDADQTLQKPSLTFTTGRLSVSGAFQVFSNLDISGACTTNSQVGLASGAVSLVRCRITNTNAGASSSGLSVGFANRIIDCWLSSTTSAPNAIAAADCAFVGCVFEDGSYGVSCSAASMVVSRCLFLGSGGAGIVITGTAGAHFQFIDGCTFVGAASDGITIATMHNNGTHVSNCLFVSNGGYGINNSTGGNVANVQRINNAFYNNTSGAENGFGDHPSLFQVTEIADPLVSAATGELKTTALSVGKGTPYPGTFENVSLTNYLDIGAHQIAAGGGSGAGAWAHRMIGGGF